MGYFDDEIYGMKSIVENLENQLDDLRREYNIPKSYYCCDCKYFENNYKTLLGTKRNYCKVKNKQVNNVSPPCKHFIEA